MNGDSVLQNLQVETCEFDVRSFVSHLPLDTRNGFSYENYGYFVSFHNIPIHYVLACLFDVSNIYIYTYIYRVSQEECARLREGVPYVKVYAPYLSADNLIHSRP